MGRVNTYSTNTEDRNPRDTNPRISVSKMSSPSERDYDRILESEDEDGSSFRQSNLSGTSTERAQKKHLKESNIFLMKVIHGRVHNDLLASRITSTDRENLSTLIPHLVQNT